VWVASDDVTGDGKADIVVGTDGSFAPLVKIYSGANGSLVRTQDVSKLGLTGGARVAAADLNGDGKADVIVGGGPGGVARVGAFDGANGKPLYDYQPFDPGYTGGVTLAAGDVTGDGVPDVLVGQAGGGDQVKVFSGLDTSSAWNLDALPGTTGGVRVGVADADGDGVVDVLAGSGPGGGEVRGYAAAGGGQIFSLTPFGAGYTGGTFVAGDPRPVAAVHSLLVTPTLTITATLSAIPESVGQGYVYPFTISRNDASTSITVFLNWGGTASGGFMGDYMPTNGLPMSVGVSSIPVPVTINNDTLVEGPETIVATISPSSAYTVGSPSSAATTIVDDDGPDGAAPAAAAMSGCATAYAAAPGTPANTILPYRPGEDDAGMPVILPAYPGDTGGVNTTMLEVVGTGVGPDGTIVCSSCPPWANTAWSDAPQAGFGSAGNNRGAADLPSLIVGGSVVAIRGCGQAEYFDQSGGNYTARDGAPDTLTHDTSGHTFTFTDSSGQQFTFYDNNSSYPAGQQGMLASQTDAGGNPVGSTTFNGSGQMIQRVRHQLTTDGTTTSLVVTYTYTGNLLATATLAEQIGSGSLVTIQTAAYTYYDGSTGNGNAGDLQTVVIEDPSSNVLETHYFRYYTSNTSPGYTGGLKYQVTGAAYERAKAWGAAQTPTPLTVDQMTDAQLAPFADLYLEYDSAHRVTRLDAQAGGCSVCSGGIGTFTYSYATSTFASGYNSWRTKRTETRPDGSVNVGYFNYVNEPILVVHQEGGQSWPTFYKYDTTSGRPVLAAAPSAVSGYDETKADLLNNQSGNYQYLRDSQGLVLTYAYGASTSATTTTAGNVTGYLSTTGEQRGESGTNVPQGTTHYIARTVGSKSVYPVADVTVYRNDNGTGGQTTSASYTWNTGSYRPASATVTLPAVTTGENGPGTATSYTVVYDAYGRVAWMKDAGGFLTYLAYDDLTGAMTKRIDDVDTTRTSTFTHLPTGWTTPTGGGLHLTTNYQVDLLGRTTKETSPAGNVTYTVYNDSSHEVRIYPGWDSTNNVPTGPTQVYREDRARGYTESLTMSATPNLTGGRPDGSEAIANVQSLSRDVLNAAGQVVDEDEYVSLAGTSYSALSVTLGASGTNYNRTQFAYDHLGRLNRTVTPTGTIYRTVTDGQGRVVSTWVGTNDTPGSGFWSPTNNTSPSNMVDTTDFQYDAGGVGDGLLTQATEHPGGGATDRVTAFAYDWRGRPVAIKQGVESSESTSVNRPIAYEVLDNLSQVTETDLYDGDGLSITSDADGDGVPDHPSSSALQAKVTAAFDEVGQEYQEKTYSVDPSSGSVSTNALTTNHWFDSRGNEIKSSLSGGEVDKTTYDGAGRPTVEYVTDGGGDTGYSDASSVTGDAVLEQTELSYDADGNTIQTTTRERFHDQTVTGALGTPTTGVHARVSYQAAYFDKADRLTDSVDVGTNGGTAYTRPSSVPSRSDSMLVNSTGYNAAGLAESSTDPAGIAGKTYYDMAGQVTKSIDDYTTGTVGDNHDETVEFTYNGNGQNVNTSADLTGGGQETTANVYGVGSSGNLYSNDLVAAVEYPDPTTGNPSSSSEDTYTYNQLGDVLTKTDRNGTVHTYTYDVLGRVTSDAVTTLGTGVDGTVRRIDTSYDGAGNAYLVTSYDAATAGNVVNQVQRAFNGLGQLTQEWQATSGSVNTSTTPSVQYACAFAPSGSNNTDRLTSITYPNGRVITYSYASGVDDAIGRLSSISDGGTTLETYSYLGLGTVVRRAHPQTGVDLTYISTTGSTGDAGDQYVGLDRFGRVVDQNWYNASTSTTADDRLYGYDRNSNVLYMKNTVSTSNSELYAYDGLNQLTSFQRGTLNSTNNGLTGSASRSQSWTFDAVGNFDSQTTDGTTQTRSANNQNEITSVSGATTPTYDNNGNLTTDETGRTFKYDAWNRVVEVRNSSSTLLATFRYDGMSRRIRDIEATTTDLYYSSGWQVLEERVGGNPYASYVWSPVFVDALVARDRDADGNSSNGLEERLYAIQDANWDVTSLVNASGTVVERYVYDAFGMFTVLTASWASRASSLYGWTRLFQGVAWNDATGLYDFRMRLYSPTLGRWIQMDPAGFGAGDVNLYREVSNSVVNRTDPTGLGDDDHWYDYFVVPGICRYVRACNQDSALEKKRASLPANSKVQVDDEGIPIGPLSLGSTGTHEGNKYGYAGTVAAGMIVEMLKRAGEEPLKQWLIGKGVRLVQVGGKWVMRKGAKELTEQETKALLNEFNVARRADLKKRIEQVEKQIEEQQVKLDNILRKQRNQRDRGGLDYQTNKTDERIRDLQKQLGELKHQDACLARE
jgi:RHS repeat-associated protein